MIHDRNGDVPLDFIDLRGGATDKYFWRPFTSSDGYEHPRWWDNARGTLGDPWFVQVLEAGVEVARVQLDEMVGSTRPTWVCRGSVPNNWRSSRLRWPSLRASGVSALE